MGEKTMQPTWRSPSPREWACGSTASAPAWSIPVLTTVAGGPDRVTQCYRALPGERGVDVLVLGRGPGPGVALGRGPRGRAQPVREFRVVQDRGEGHG